MIERLADLQKAEDVLKTLEDGAIYLSRNDIMAEHSDHSKDWGDHGNHDNSHDNWRDRAD